MKIKVEVDLEDLYVDYNEDGQNNFNEAIKENIATKIKQKIWDDFKINSLESFSNQVKRKIEVDKELKIKETIEVFFSEKKLKKPYGGNDLVSLEDYIKSEIEREYFRNNEFKAKVEKLIQQQSTSLVAELKQRYDLAFASQIVMNLQANNMLKEDVGKLLLNDTAKQQ